LWYGFNNKFSKNYVSNKKKYANKKLKKLQFSVQQPFNINYSVFNLVIPSNWQFVILKNKLTPYKIIYVFSNTYFYNFPLPSTKLDFFYDKSTSVIQFRTLYTNNFYPLYWNNLKLVFNSFHRPFFLKIKFKGKGYYIYKNKRNTITPQFGYAHRLYLYAYFVSVLFLSKTSIFLFGLTRSDVIYTGYAIKSMRPINIFTGRGVRFAKQIIYKKAGKVSSYR
jgi:hypothetical protein